MRSVGWLQYGQASVPPGTPRSSGDVADQMLPIRCDVLTAPIAPQALDADA